jgi:hypothetical protein
MMWERLAGLPLEVDGYTFETLSAGERVTTLMRLSGGGLEGCGEEIGLDQEGLVASAGTLPLAGSWTLESFCAHLDTLEQWPEPPEWEMARRWRNWMYESAALDLALRQARRSLPDALGLTPAPLTFVNSMGLGDPPSAAKVSARLAASPTVGFKLDAQPSWTPEIMLELAGCGAVRTIDFKGRYGLEVEDFGALGVLYDAVLEAFGDDVILEDPHEEMMERLDGVRDRISMDAPIARVADIGDLRTINVKPSRIGSLRALSDIYAHCAANDVRMYGGGMGELGIARGQIELLASLFHPDTPNDVAPSAFNLEEPPPGLPPSPLDPGTPPPGFRLS